MNTLALIVGYLLLLGGMWLLFHMRWTNWLRDDDDPLERYYYEISFACVLAILAGAAIVIMIEGGLPFQLCFSPNSCVGHTGALGWLLV